MEYLPIFMDLKTAKTVIVGGGRVASRKAALLHRACPDVVVVAPELGSAMQRWINETGCRWVQSRFQASHLEGAALVIAATDEREVNTAVYQAASARGLPVNVADQPEFCSFILPAIVDRSPAVIAISTGGRSPILARYIKAVLERVLPFALGDVTALLGRWRQRVKAAIPNDEQRRRFWEQCIDGPIGELAMNGHSAGAEEKLKQNLSQFRNEQGKVYLIGAGPGNPELITLRAQRLLQRADVVIYDRLVGREILELCRREAELIYVGKAKADHAMVQSEIEALMVKLAQEGKRVARLKGGDPFVFGRGGEELQTLVANQISYEVVPAISAANGAAAYAGLPLTHRDHTHGVSYVSGDGFDNQDQINGLVASGHTLVVYMGVGRIAKVVAALGLAGMAKTMPIAVISAGSTAAQQVLCTTLDQVQGKINAIELPAPSLLVIGTVVKLQPHLQWFQGQHRDAEAVFSAPQQTAKTKVA